MLEVGQSNKKGQVLVRKTKNKGSSVRTYIWVLRCTKCGFEYGSNSTETFERCCPNCQGGKPGYTLENLNENLKQG